MILNNLYSQATKIIPKQSAQLLKWLSRVDNGRGQYIDTYDSPVTFTGSFQSIPRELFDKMGLDYKKKYFMVYTDTKISGLDRDRSGDRVIYQGSTFKAEKEGGWKPVDGWSGVMLVEIPND